jgi:hypothetical protein
MLRNSGPQSTQQSGTMARDEENGHDERTALLQEHQGSSASKESASKLPALLNFFMGGIYAPDSSTYEPIDILLNTENAEERDLLTEKWKDNRLNELGFVGVVSALLAGVLTSTGSWPDILPNGQQSPWPVRTSWYCGIILSLFSLLAAADQTVRLYRLSSHRDGHRNLRRLLAKPQSVRNGGRLRPSRGQLYTWQMPVMFLTTATISMIVGMFLHVWSATRHLQHDTWWGPDSKVSSTIFVFRRITNASAAGRVDLYRCCGYLHCCLLCRPIYAVLSRHHGRIDP